MKPINLFIALLIFNFAFAKANTDKPETTVTSTIQEVTVYLSGAQITRNASANVNTGTTTLIIENLSPFIDENSIQVSGLQNASILSINFGLDYLNKPKHPEKIEALKKERDALNLKISRINSEIDGLRTEEEVLNSNKKLGSDTVEIDVEKLKVMAEYYRNRLTEIRNALIDADLQKKTLQSEINDINKQFQEYNVSEETQKGLITMKINSSEVANLDLVISYVVSEAGWFPMYDLRANTVNAPLDLLYKSHIYQKTGVDWNDVNLVLSTGDPNIDNNKPDVDTKFLNFVNPHSYRNTTRATSAYKYKYNPNVKFVTGTVYDENGPLPGASVIIEGTNNGVQTDFDGRFSLEVSEGERLSFSYVGYKTQQIPVHASNINITLEEDNNALDEVVVTAQGLKREKKASGYAISEALTGKSSGVSGSAKNVVIRGYSSINGNNEPLYIVDGVPFDNSESNNLLYGNTSSSRSLGLDPNQIKDVKVLKGLAAATLYGSSGKNGVIVITTKSGTATGQYKVQAITTTRFEIANPYSIATDGDVTIIEIDKFVVPASYEYYAAPILNENVFLTAKINNWEQYNLLPGEANIYFEGSYSGKTYLDPLATTQDLTISLGVDPNVVVKREQLDNFKATSFLGNQKIVDNVFELTVKNNKSSAISIKLIDRIPKSQNKDIKVDEVNPGDAVYNKETGLLNWTLNIPTNSSLEKRLSYRLKYPKHKNINL